MTTIPRAGGYGRAPGDRFRVEVSGPELHRRGGLYGVGRARCRDEGAGKAIEKQYDNWALGTVDSGVFRYRSNGGQLLAVPGAILLGNAGETFSCRHCDPLGNRRSVVAVGHRLMSEVAGALGLTDVAFRVPAIPAGPQSVALYGAIRRLTQSEQVLEDVVIELLAAVLGAGRKQRGWTGHPGSARRVLEVVRYLETHFTDAHRLADLAALARLSRFHFIRVFRQMTGVSPHQYLIGLRLRAAAERLQTTGQPVTSVALETGFNDISHFNRTFRRAFGVTPRRWRERR